MRTAVLDVDGVLIDVRDSFRECVRRTVVAVQEMNGVPAPWRPSTHDIGAFKRTPGFNDDVDLAVVLARIALAGRGPEAPMLAELIAGTDPPGRLAAVVRGAPVVDGALVARLFNENYWGADGYARVFGEPAVHVSGEGLEGRERPLVGADFVARLRGRGVGGVALVTGRTPVETAAALARLGWRASDLDVIVDGSVARKPDPRCLDAVAAACGAGPAVVAGDTRDDWELVRRYRAERQRGMPVAFVAVTAVADEVGEAVAVDGRVAGAEELLALLGPVTGA